MEEMSPKEYRESKIYRIRHSAAHMMAAAVLEKFPDAKIAIGPPIEHGFYYDFDLPRPLTEEDLAEIETRTRALIKESRDFRYEEISPEEARALFSDQPYKLELIDELQFGDSCHTLRGRYACAFHPRMAGYAKQFDPGYAKTGSVYVKIV